VHHPTTLPLGATRHADGRTSFLVWAPRATRVELVRPTPPGEPAAPAVELTPAGGGYHAVVVDDAPPGTRYRYRLHRDGGAPVERPDPASRWQPDGLHGPSAVPAPAEGFAWTDDAWRCPPLGEHVLYELHVGTFTPEGTFDAAAGRLADLAELGVTAIELMPVAQVPGDRNWGYDGVLPYAVQHSYGGPDGLRGLVDAAHAAGVAVVLDVVHNHVGPEGNHLADFGPYFTDRYATPWGEAVNVDGEDSDPVRRFLVDNAVRWIDEFHLDGLRLDAVHAIQDASATHLLEELATAVHDAADRAGRRALLIAESDLQDPRLVRSPAVGGYGLDAQWLDDVHHAVHVAATGERDGYYVDYTGLDDLARSLRDRFAYAGRYSPYRRRTVGRPARDVPYERFVVCSQNHDQVGNRMLGERLSALVDRETEKATAAAVLLSPFTPMLFMGQEYGETAPFQYFVSHTEEWLVEAVRTGRREEFAAFGWEGDVPDAQDPATFHRSTLDWSLRDHPDHRPLLDLHRELLALRRRHPAIAGPDAGEATPSRHGAEALAWHRRAVDHEVVVVVNPGDAPVEVALARPGPWRVVLDTADERFAGPGADDDPTWGGPDGLAGTIGPRRVVVLDRDRDAEAAR
jgi:maltooligosyltrehalose trehalohydrolase